MSMWHQSLYLLANINIIIVAHYGTYFAHKMYVCSILMRNIIQFMYLLQVKLDELWQVPVHLLGGGPSPRSLKLSDSGHMPESSTPTMRSPSVFDLSTCREKPMKSHDFVVWSCFFRLGNTVTTPSSPKHCVPEIIFFRLCKHVERNIQSKLWC